jgi:endonuclease G
MTSQKKPAPKRRSSAKPRKTSSRSANRTLKGFIAAAVTTFGIASCALNPQWRDDFSLEPILTQLGIPGQDSTAPLASASGPQVQTRFASCPQFFPGGQPPLVPSAPSLRELCFSAFAILHNGQTKTPVVVAQRLNRKMMAQTSGVQRTDRFYAEARLPQAERADLADYRGSGYSRGHMAPAGDMHNSEAMAQSFSLANMVPQDQTHNGGPWSRIEQDTRKYIARATGDVFVFTGPIYATRPGTVGAGRVAVPSHVFKLVYDVSNGRSWVHWQANHPDTRVGAPISYDEFVRRTGMHLLPTPQR